MTKADLIEEVSRVVEMTRKDSEVIVEAIFDSIVRSLRTGDKIEIRRVRQLPDAGSGSPELAETRRPARGWKYLRNEFRTLSRAGTEGPCEHLFFERLARRSKNGETPEPAPTPADQVS